jgi:uncharacterized protein
MKKYTVKPRLKQKGELVLSNASPQIRPWVYLGRLAEAAPVTRVLYNIERPHVISIVGKRGSGKSYTMGSFLEGLCTKSLSSSISSIDRAAAVILFDTLGIFQWTNIHLARAANTDALNEQKRVWRGWDINDEELDVEVWYPKGLESRRPTEAARNFSVRTTDLDAADWGYLLGLDIYQDRMGQLLNDVYLKVTEEGWQSERNVHAPQSDYSVLDLLTCLNEDIEIEQTYQRETIRAIGQQLKTFVRNPLFEKKGTPLNELLAPGKMSVFVMNQMSAPLRLIVMSAIIRRLLASRIRATEFEKSLALGAYADADQRAELERLAEQAIPPTWVALDEAQNVLPSERKNPAGEILVRFVREGRNYGLSFAIATQQPTAIDARIMAQVDTLIVHRLSVHGDIEHIKKNLKANLPEEIRYAGAQLSLEEALRSLDVGQALVSSSDSERSFFVDIRPRITAHGGF